MGILSLFCFGLFCVIFGYAAGAAKAAWLHHRTKRLVIELEYTEERLTQLQKDIEITLAENGMLQDIIE